MDNGCCIAGGKNGLIWLDDPSFSLRTSTACLAVCIASATASHMKQRWGEAMICYDGTKRFQWNKGMENDGNLNSAWCNGVGWQHSMTAWRFQWNGESLWLIAIWNKFLYPRVNKHGNEKWPILQIHLPSGNLTYVLIGKPSINGQFSMAMLNNQRVDDFSFAYRTWHT